MTLIWAEWTALRTHCFFARSDWTEAHMVLVAIVSAPQAEGRQFDPSQMCTSTGDRHIFMWSRKLIVI